MRAVFVLFDSLNRHALEAYGGTGVRTPNLTRLAERAVTFDTHYVGSLPCIPARRDLHTGRIGFLHRSWGPLEPFDNSFPEILQRHGIYAHLATDHHHYFADGAGTYHQRYSSFELVRGQAIDRWKPVVAPPRERFGAAYHSLQHQRLSYMINRDFMVAEEDMCCPQVFKAGFAFLERNRRADNWFLQIECFDPHEPFFAPERFKAPYATAYDGPVLDWPPYQRVRQSCAEVAELRANYAALLAMCDAYLGRLLDYFDVHDLWRDTALILTTDHGFLLGEHGWWAKNRMPCYNEIAHIPLIVYHPELAGAAGGRRRALTHASDVMPTVLDLFGIAPPAEVEGRSLLPVLQRDAPVREAALYGLFGAACNVTDGRYTYFRYPRDMAADDLFEYTLMPTRMKSRFALDELRNAALVPPRSFSKGAPLLRLAARRDGQGRPLDCQDMTFEDTTTALYDLADDPGQERPIDDPATERRLLAHMRALMAANDVAPETYRRFGLEAA